MVARTLFILFLLHMCGLLYACARARACVCGCILLYPLFTFTDRELRNSHDVAPRLRNVRFIQLVLSLKVVGGSETSLLFATRVCRPALFVTVPNNIMMMIILL